MDEEYTEGKKKLDREYFELMRKNSLWTEMGWWFFDANRLPEGERKEFLRQLWEELTPDQRRLTESM